MDEETTRGLPLRPGRGRRPVPAGPLLPMLGAPTASGKSAAALRLAGELDLEIVSADAMQVYRGMDIGTAKPSAAERHLVPHHMLDVVDPDEPYSVADYVLGAERAIAGILERGRLPLVAGGTGFYLQALESGLPTVPPADPAAQAELWEALDRSGLEPLLRELAAASPEDAERAQRNPRRVVRALEVLRRTGRPPRDFPRTRPRFRYSKAVLLPPVEALAGRIEARVGTMFAAGLVEEVRRLLERYPRQPTALQAIGYKEVAEALAGRCSLDEARRQVVGATLRYAKRQRTWFRKDSAAWRLGVLAEEALPQLRSWLQELAAGSSG